MSGGDINATELVAAIINQKDNLIEGIRYAQELIDGSMTMLLLTPRGHVRRPGPAGPYARLPSAERRMPTAPPLKALRI